MRNAATWFRLLLFALLVIGTAGMHTIGHPPEAGAAAPAAEFRTHADAATASGMMYADPAPADDCPSGHCSTADRERAAGHDSGSGGDFPGEHGGMDPMSLCLAIALAAFVLAVTWFALRRGARHRADAASGAWGRLTSGLPPPRRPDPSRLAVLRI